MTQNQISVSTVNNPQSAPPPPSASSAIGMSTPSHPDVPSIFNMSLLRDLNEADEQEVKRKDQEDEQIDV